MLTQQTQDPPLWKIVKGRDTKKKKKKKKKTKKKTKKIVY